MRRVVSEPMAVLLSLLSSGFTLNQIKTAFGDAHMLQYLGLNPDLKAEYLSLIEEGEGEGEA